MPLFSVELGIIPCKGALCQWNNGETHCLSLTGGPEKRYKVGQGHEMKDHIDKYARKLLRDRTAIPESIRFYVLDDRVITNREDEWLPVFAEVFSGLNVTALLFAKTTLPFADFLIVRSDPGVERITPKDTETRTFLHDIPFIRKNEWSESSPQERPGKIIRCLKERRAMVIEGLGVVATGGVTVEQSFIAFSMIFHTTFVKYLLDLLTDGFKLPGEREAFKDFQSKWVRPIDSSGLQFTAGPLGYRGECGGAPP